MDEDLIHATPGLFLEEHQIPTFDVASVVQMALTANQHAALTSYMESIGEEAFIASPVLYALNHDDPGLAMNYLMMDVTENGRWTANLLEQRLAERELFQS